MAELEMVPLDTIDDILLWKPYSFAKNQSQLDLSKRFLREYFTIHRSNIHHHNIYSTELVEQHSNCSLSFQYLMAYPNDCVSGNSKFSISLDFTCLS